MKKIVLISLLFALSLFAQENEFDPVLGEKFQTVLDSIIQISDSKGVSACVIMPEKGIWTGVSGISHVGQPITPDMHFWIASNTKTFAAVLIMMLVEKGIISLNDPISDWLPAYNNIDGSILIRQLLNHTSGVYDYIDHPQYETELFADPGRYWSPEYTLHYVLPPYFPPGNGWRYSSTNYILVGLILKNAFATDTLATVLRDSIFNSLQLNDTYLGIEEGHIGTLAHGWSDIQGNSDREDLTTISDTSMLSSLWTAGAIISTASDMAKWIRDLYTGDLLSSVSKSEMTDFVENSGWPPIVIRHGLGTTLLVVDGDSLYGHGGYYYGYNSEIAFDPKRNISVAVLMNRDSFDQWPQWTDLMVQEIFRKIVSYKTSIRDDAPILPFEYSLDQNYPNPFNPSTTIEFTLPKSEYVELKVYNILGKEVATLVAKKLNQGNHIYQFDGKNLASGVYYYQLVAGDYREVKKMILLR
jgi:D-alanyl-D-alanine carboxypeptidase